MKKTNRQAIAVLWVFVALLCMSCTIFSASDAPAKFVQIVLEWLALVGGVVFGFNN